MAPKNGTNIGKMNHIGKVARNHIHPEFMRGKDSMASAPTGNKAFGGADHHKFESLHHFASPPELYQSGPEGENESCD